MLNITDITKYYISITFSENVSSVIYNSFSLMEAFGILYYEDKYVDLISKEESIDNDTKMDTFLLYLYRDMSNIINEHSIYLDTDIDVNLSELNEIVHFLYTVQILEDYEYVSYRINSSDDDKKIIISLIDKYTLLSTIRLMEIIKSVDYKLILSLKNFIEDKETLIDRETIDKNRKKYIDDFMIFINKVDCLGRELYENGYTDTTLEELLNIIPYSLNEKIDSLIITNLPQASLDVLSILVITKDTYSMPLLKFNNNTNMFTEKLENITKLSSTISNILNDFNVYLEAKKQNNGLEEL